MPAVSAAATYPVSNSLQLMLISLEQADELCLSLVSNHRRVRFERCTFLSTNASSIEQPVRYVVLGLPSFNNG